MMKLNQHRAVFCCLVATALSAHVAAASALPANAVIGEDEIAIAAGATSSANFSALSAVTRQAAPQPLASANFRNYPGFRYAFAAPVDAAGPSIETFSLPSRSTTLTVPVTFIAGGSVLGYCVGETNDAAGCSWSSSPPASYTFGSAGNRMLYGWVSDGAGNVSVPASATVAITLSDAAPVVATFSVPSQAGSLTVTGIVLTATGSADIAGYLLTESDTRPAADDSRWSASPLTSYTFSSAGVKTLYAWVKDVNGAVSTGAAQTVTVTISSLKPGDCNRDGAVTIAEVQTAINMFLGMKTSELCVDIDNSGSVSIAEVQRAINAFLGM